MITRAIGSGTIAFGLVSVPFKVYTANVSNGVAFNMLHGKCGGRMKQQYFCPVDNEIVERKDMVKGFEFAKDQYVRFTEEELKKLQAEKTDTLDIVEFVPLDSVDLLQIEKSYYVGPDKGGEKSYALLCLAMREMNVIGVGRYFTHGKEQLVLVRPYRDGLILHYAFYASEVRPFEGIAPKGPEFKDQEIEMAMRLVDQLTSESFEPGKYSDEYIDRVRNAVEAKIAGKDVTAMHESPKPTILDVFEALKRSLKPEALLKPPPNRRRTRKRVES